MLSINIVFIFDFVFDTFLYQRTVLIEIGNNFVMDKIIKKIIVTSLRS